MKKSLAIYLAVVALWGCSNTRQEQSPLSRQLAEETPQISQLEEIVVTPKPVEIEETHELPLKEHFLRATLALMKQKLPGDIVDRLNRMQKEEEEKAEILLFEKIARADKYTRAEIANFINQMPDRYVEDENCHDEFEKFRVFQLIFNSKGKVIGAVASAIEKNKFMVTQSVKFGLNYRSEKDAIFFDGMTIYPEADECVLFYDTYTYFNEKIGERRTVPVGILKKNRLIPNEEYEKWLDKFLEEEATGKVVKLQTNKIIELFNPQYIVE